MTVRLPLLILLLAVTWTSATAIAEEGCDGDEHCNGGETGARPHLAELAGPEQVENRLHIDSNQVGPLVPGRFARGYFEWKEALNSRLTL